MVQVDTSRWREFRVGDYYKIYHGQRLKSTDRIEGDIPLLTAGCENQGVAGYIGNTNVPSYKDAMTIDMFGNCFLHDGFYAGDDNIYFYVNSDMSYMIKLFIVSVLQADLKGKYDFSYQFRQSQADVLSVKLPATSSGDPDWDYMENYMREIMQESEASLEDLRRADKSKTKIDSSGWKEFRVGEVFEIGNTGSILAKDVHDGSGTTPYVTASYENNGVVAYVDGSAYDLIPGGCILIGGKTFSITYQERDFISNDSHNLHVRLKNRVGSKSMYLFIVAVFRSALAYKYTWGDAVIKKKLADDVVILPATSSGDPDWDYMDAYMRKIMQESEETLHSLKVS